MDSDIMSYYVDVFNSPTAFSFIWIKCLPYIPLLVHRSPLAKEVACKSMRQEIEDRIVEKPDVINPA